MAGNLQPLVNNQRIVKDDGTPTDYFIRWAQQKQIDIGSGITAEQALEIITQYLADHELQPGSGIQITPSGNLSDTPTIAAEVQAILDQITDVRGSILFRGAAGWEALAPGTAGQMLRTNGPGADPAWAAGGGGGASWNLVQHVNIAAPAAVVDVVGLAGYQDILLIARLVTASVSGRRSLQVSVDNGATFFAGTGEYPYIVNTGIENNTGVPFSQMCAMHETNATAARDGICYIFAAGANGAPKHIQNLVSQTQWLFVGSPLPINAVRLLNAGGGNLTGGDFYVFAR